MIKIIDVDKLFDKYIEKYVYANIGKIKPEEIENKIPVLYDEFGDKELSELDNKTPNTFYKQYSGDELLECLKEHIEKGVSVSDFLCEAMISKDDIDKKIYQLLLKENGEEYTLYLMNILNDIGSDIAIKGYLEFIVWDYSEPIRELATELLCGYADLIKEDILLQFKDTEEGKKVNLTEILSHAKKDDRIFNILIEEFVKNSDNIPLYAGYLASYGDERALPFLEATIEGDKINYADFEELRFAIEALGGEYKGKRDFTSDSTYKKIKATKPVQKEN